jgi:hypothetical protein
MGFPEAPEKPRGLMAILRNPATVSGILVGWACLVFGGMVVSDLAGDAAFALAIAPPLIAGLLLQKRYPSFARGLLLGFPNGTGHQPAGAGHYRPLLLLRTLNPHP